jgi:hypothetical protein
MPARPSSSAATCSITRQAVAVEATSPNSSGWSRRTVRSEKAVATVGQQHGKITQHRARVMAMPRGLAAACPPRQRGGQPKPVGRLAKQRRPSMPGGPIAIAGDLEPRWRLGSLHPQGALLRQRM